MKILTLNQLIENWHIFPRAITREQIDEMDLDELLLALNISCPQLDDYENGLIITDFDFTTYHNPAITFNN